MSELLITCPLCRQPGFTARGLRGHYCASAATQQSKEKLHKQDWWVAVDAARVAAGMEEMVYGYEVTYQLRNQTEGTVHGVGSKSSVVMKARMTSLFSKVILIEELSYRTYCKAYGIPGSKM